MNKIFKKVLALISAAIVIYSLIKIPNSKNPIDASIAKIEMLLVVITISGFWLLLLVNEKFKEKTGQNFFLDRLAGRGQSYGILQSYDKACRDQKRIISSKRNRAKNPQSLHPQGIIFGRSNGRWVFSPAIGSSAPHCFVYGATGSGKTQSIILPTIAAWPKNSHIFCIDVSGDISNTIDQNPWMRGEYIPLDFSSWDANVRFDVFNEIKCKSEQARKCGADIAQIKAIEENEIEKIALCLIPYPKQGDSSNQYFVDGGRDLLCSTLLAGYFSNREFVETLTFLTETPLDSLIRQLSGCGVKKAIVKVNQFIGQSEKNLAGVRGEAVKAAERIIKNSIASRILTPPSQEEKAILLSPKSIENHDIFIRLSMTDINVLSPIIGLIISQMSDYFYSRNISYAEQHPILIIADELASYCKYWPGIENDFRNLRKFGIRFLMCAQDFSSIDNEIGKSKRETILANTGYKIILNAFVAADQRELSNIVGKEETLKRIQNFSPYSPNSFSDRWEFQDVIPPEDFGTLSAKHKLIILSPEGWEEISTAPFWKYQDLLHTAVSNII